MNVDRFTREREQNWDELERLVTAARTRPERLGAESVRRLGALYRQTAADLALARRRLPGETVVARLDSLVGRARSLVYDADPRRESLVEFFTTGYWRRVRERPRLLLLAIVLMAAPAVLAFVWAGHDPGAAAGVVPSMFRNAGEPHRAGHGLGVSGGQSAALASAIMTNNIRVTLVAFAGGIAAGVITTAILLYNGVLLGVVGGLSTHAGSGSRFVELVVAHGVLELSCIAVAGMAGLRLAGAVIAPGRRPRSVAIPAEARRTVELALGTAPWLVVAGLVEGFITPAGYGLVANTVIGVVLGTLFWGLVLWRGTREHIGTDRSSVRLEDMVESSTTG